MGPKFVQFQTSPDNRPKNVDRSEIGHDPSTKNVLVHILNCYVKKSDNECKQVHQQDAYPTNAGGAVKTVQHTTPISRATFPLLVIAYSKLLKLTAASKALTKQ